MPSASGALPDNDIVVPIPTVSARHAQIESTPDGQIVVRDLGSTHGLLRGGQRVSACTLLPGEKVNIGVEVELEYSTPVDLTMLRVIAPSPVAASVSVSETAVGTAPLGPGAWARSLNLADHEQATFGRARQSRGAGSPARQPLPRRGRTHGHALRAWVIRWPPTPAGRCPKPNGSG